jgi:hypothetical protein
VQDKVEGLIVETQHVSVSELEERAQVLPYKVRIKMGQGGKEQLHLARQRREQRGWELISIFPQSTERVEGLGPLLNRPAVVVILLFQRSQREAAQTMPF